MTGVLSQTQSQRQTLAPQMRQGLKMLAMSLPELRSELIAEMAKNPVIDDVEPTLEKTTVSEREQQLAEDERIADYPEDDDMRDAAYMDGIARGKNGSDLDAMARRERFFENQVSEETLERHLVAQLPASDIDETDYSLAEMLIGELNDDGLFVGSLPDIIMVSGEQEAKVRSLLAKIRELDPPGCGAMTLAECLVAQLDKIDDSALRARVAKLIGDLEAVAAGQVNDAEALAALRTLDPRPGRAYRHDVRGSEYVNPEVHAVRCADGWVARVDARSLPEIRISSKYVTMLEDPTTAAETKAYIRERIAAANGLSADEAFAKVITWYDGYRFGKSEIFNPWSVINYFGSDCIPRAFWLSTGSNDVIGEILAVADEEVYERLHELMLGKSFLSTIDTSVIYPKIRQNPSSIYSFLVVSGYLKAEEIGISPSGDMMCNVSLPNKEIALVYNKETLAKLDIVAE